MEDVHTDFYQTQTAFYTYWKKHDITEKGKGWKAFKRWEWFMEPRLYPDGDKNEMANAFLNYQKQSKQNKKSSSAGNWSLIGPSVVPASGGGAGRINFITIHPRDSNTFFIGAPAGGLWYTTDGGSSWTTTTDDLETIGTSDLVINPLNPNVMYLATGDGDGGATYSIGVLKSTNGGISWNPTGLDWSVSSAWKINKLLLNPNDTSILFAATNGGIYRSDNSGSSWSLVQNGSFKDIEFRPNDPDIVYACGNQFYKSSDAGEHFTQIANGLPSSTVINRMAIAVTEANSDYVYILAAATSSGSYGFYGFYQSTDKGSSFNTQATSPNLLGWESSGSDVGGQGWYDLAIIASSKDANTVYTAGVNIWKTTDGGLSWNINSHWYGQYGNPYVHADIHSLQFNGSSLFACTDGGLFKTDNMGTSWSDVSDGLAIRQCYRIGLSASNKDLFISGNQDNGTDVYRSGYWSRVLGGDGMECMVDYNDERFLYGEYYYGSLMKSINGGISFSGITSGITENGAWVTPFIMDPSDPKILYAGFNNVWKSTDRGDTWTSISNFASTNTLNALAVAASNTNNIYAAAYSKIYKTNDGGSSWTDISSGLPVSSASLTYIAVDPSDPDHLYVTFSGYVSGKKVYESNDGGSNWNNISGTLPNLPVNCIVYETGADALYIGIDAGVYYIDNSLSDWISFSNQLPNTIINELEIHYSSATIKAATFGRGVWESPLFSAQTMPPTADFTSDNTEICAGENIQFTDMSIYSPTAWNWTFQGGTPSVSTDQSPIVTYPTEGIFDVTLIAENSNGSNTIIYSGYIIVGSTALPFEEKLNASSFPPDNWDVINADNDITWDQETVVSADGSTSSCAFLNFYNYSSAGAIDELICPSLDLSSYSDSILLSFNVAYCNYDSGYEDGLNIHVSKDCGTTYDSISVYGKSGSLLETTLSSTTEFFPTDASQWRNEVIGLSAYAGFDIVLKFEGLNDYGNNLFIDDINVIYYGSASSSMNEKNNPENNLNLYPNPAKKVLYFNFISKSNDFISYELRDVNAKVIYSNKADVLFGINQISISLEHFAKGVYSFTMETEDEIINRKLVIE
jgi:PKD repeat protein